MAKTKYKKTNTKLKVYNKVVISSKLKNRCTLSENKKIKKIIEKD